MFKRAIALAALTLAASAAVAVETYRQQSAIISDAAATAVVESFAKALEDYFLYPEIGLRYAAKLRSNQASARYSGLSAEKFTQVITDDLQSVYPDGHLRLQRPRPKPVLAHLASALPEGGAEPTGIEKAGWIDDGVAYVSLTEFPGSKTSLAGLQAFLDKHSTARALILDLRTHGGGYTDEVDLLASYLFEVPTPLMYMDTREAAFRPKPDSPTLKRIPGPAAMIRQVNLAAPAERATNLRRAKVFVLTSGYTGSAAEHLTLALKLTGRATIIGETTGGAGHFGKIVDLPGGYTAFIPIGRPFDPSTGEGWEGTGVEPNVSVPAGDALIVALRQIGISPQRATALSTRWSPSGSMERILPLRKRAGPAPM